MTHNNDHNNEQNPQPFAFNYKMISLILVYQLWIVALIQAYGWLPAIFASVVTGGWLSGWPKGILKNTIFVFVFSIILPLSIIVGLELEANPVNP